MSYQAMKRYRGTLHAHYYVKEANLKRLYNCMISTIIYDFLKKAKPWRQEKVSGCWEFRAGRDEPAERRGF